MKKLTFVLFALLIFGVSFRPAVAQDRNQAVQAVVNLETDIRNAVLQAPHYGVFDSLSFQLDNNNVTLLGHVLLPITREEIVRRVAKLPGICKVTDAIKVLPLSKSDDAIRLHVYRLVFNTSDLYRYALSPNPSIHIIVNGGHVTLEGVVNNEGDSRYAYMAARKANGVFSVTNNLEIQGTK